MNQIIEYRPIHSGDIRNLMVCQTCGSVVYDMCMGMHTDTHAQTPEPVEPPAEQWPTQKEAHDAARITINRTTPKNDISITSDFPMSNAVKAALADLDKQPTPVVHHYTTEVPDAGGWSIPEPVVSMLSDDVQKALAQLRAGNTFTFHDDACTHTPKLPSREIAVEELARAYENASGSEYPDYLATRRGIEAVVARVFAYLETGK